MQVRPRELSILAGMAIVAIASVLIANSEISNIQQRRDPLLSRYSRSLEALDDVDHLVRASEGSEEVVRAYLRAPDPGLVKQLDESRKEAGAALRRLRERVPGDLSKILKRVQDLSTRSWAEADRVIAEERAGASRLDLLQGLEGRLGPVREELDAAVHQLEGELKAHITSVTRDTDRLLAESHRAVLISSGASAGLLLLFGLLLFQLSPVHRRSREIAETHSAELDAILSCLPQAVWVRGPGGVRRINRRGLELLGIDGSAELDDDMAAFFERFRVRSADTGLPIRPEETPIAGAFVGATGAQDILITPANASHDITVRIRAAPLQQAGRTLGVIIVATDMTEQKQQDHKLRVSEATLAGIISLANDAIVTIDEAQNIVLFNQGAERIFGYKSSEIVGRPLDVLIPDRFRRAHRGHVHAFATGAASGRQMEERRELRALRRDDEEFPAEASISKLSTDGHLTMVAVLRDITERKRHEEELAMLARAGRTFSESLERQETVDHVAQISVPALAELSRVYLVAPNGAIELAASAQASDLNPPSSDEGWRTDPQLDSYGVRRVIRTGAAQLISNIAEVMLDKPPDRSEPLDARGQWQLGSVLTVPIRGHGRVLGALCLMAGTLRRPFDERDAHLAEDLARRAGVAIENSILYADAQRSAQLRDDVLAIVAHDLRTPVTSIMLSARVLTMSTGRRAEEKEGADRIATILRASHRLNALVQDLIEVGRMESGHFVMEWDSVEPMLVVAEVLEEHDDLARAASLHLSSQIEGDLPGVRADRQRLVQALGNLVGNAIKFTPKGGQVVVGARREAEDLVFWVSDTGPGMAQNDIDRLFERFWQGYAGDRRGVGLGLSICKAIVEAHQGRIWVRSQLGFGTMFYFSIPLATAETCSASGSPTTQGVESPSPSRAGPD